MVKKTVKKTAKTPKPSPIKNTRLGISDFLIGRIEKAESESNMVANTAKYLDPQSLNSLCLNWLFNGGLYNAMTIVSGPEGSGKTTVTNEVLGSGLNSQFLWSSFIDAEGTLNDELMANMLLKQGIDRYGDAGRPFRYYKENVIEDVFDYMVKLLNMLPLKIWSVKAKTWTYQFPKRNPFFASLMERYEVKPDKSLTSANFFVCPTDNSKLEASFTIDSLAAMLTESDEENEKRSKIRAAEATACSNNLRRIAAKTSKRGVLLFAVNQTRESPNATYGGPTTYMPGGKAPGFYSSQRAELNSRSSGFRSGMCVYDTKVKAYTEPSIIDGYRDRYMYKSVRNTKNKMGNPGKETWIRIWIADYKGEAFGIDPFFDVLEYLTTTNQIVKTRRKANMQLWKFKLKSSVGKERASFLNALPEFSELALKTLVLSEVFKDPNHIKLAMKRMGLNRRVGLRNSLFAQLERDKDIMALNNGKLKESDDEDLEDEDLVEV